MKKTFTPPRGISKLLISGVLIAITFTAMAQNGPKWATGGNTLSGGEVLGSKNNFPLNFIVNSQQELAILTNGNIQVASLNNGNTGLVTYSSNGTLIPLNFTGNSGQVLSGNGTWVAGSSFSQWITNGSNIYYNGGYVGIGLPNPTAPLTVSGNIVSTGNVYGNTLAAANSVQIGTVKITSTGNVDTLRSTSSLQVNATTVNAGVVNTGLLNTINFASDSIRTSNMISKDSIFNFGVYQDPPGPVPIIYWTPLVVNAHASPPLIGDCTTNPIDFATCSGILFTDKGYSCKTALGIGAWNANSALTISSCSAANPLSILN